MNLRLYNARDIWLNRDMLYLIFTVDGDWDEYFYRNLSEEERAPKVDALTTLVQREIEMAGKILRGRFIHFAHTSFRARDFFIKEPFLELWKKLTRNNGDVGLHCHEDDPYKAYYYKDASRMKSVITERAKAFREAGLSIKSYRSGFLGFSNKITEILEKNDIYFDFSCEPGRYLAHKNYIVSDWRGAPEYNYRMDYEDHRKKGSSKVWEIPVGVSKGKYLYFEKSSLKDIEKIAIDLKQRSIIDSKRDIVVSVLSHTYEYASQGRIEDIEAKLTLLKRYGTFIGVKELENILNKK